MKHKKGLPMLPLQFLVPAIAAIGLAAFMGGCGDKNVEIAGVCPAVISTIPKNGAVVVPLDQILTMPFNEGATISQASFGEKSSITKSSAFSNFSYMDLR